MNALYNLDVPDELAKLDLKTADKKEIINVTCHAWMDSFGSFGDRIDSEPLYNSACKMIAPFRNKIKGKICSADAGVKASDRNKSFVGYFLSAVLNETEADTLEYGLPNAVWSSLGYCLKGGKTLEIKKGVLGEYAGMNAEGGTIVNRGMVYELGTHATGGLFINHTKMWCVRDTLGSDKTDKVRAGYSARNSILINFGDIDSIPMFENGGIFLDYSKSPCECFSVRNKSPELNLVVYGDMKKDTVLATLLEDIKRECRKKRYGDVT